MTKPSEVTVSDDLVKIFREAAMRADYLAMPGKWISDVEIRAGLAAVIAARVPDIADVSRFDSRAHEFRDKVIKGV